MLTHLMALLGVLCVVRGIPTEVNITSEQGAGQVSIVQYETNADFRWNITNLGVCQGGNAIVTLTWVSVAIGKGGDIIVVKNGGSSAARILQQVSGNTLGAAVNSTGPSLYITFTSDEIKQPGELGFSFRYDFKCGPKIDTNVNCRPPSDPRVFSTTGSGRGLIQFEDLEGDLQDCAWLISNDIPNCPNPYIEIDFRNFSALFPYDRLELYDGNQTDVSKEIGSYQGTKVYYGPGFQYSVGKQMLIVFHNEFAHSNTDDTWTGFSAFFIGRCNAQPNANCPSRENPRIYNSAQPNYMVFSPGQYRPNLNCYFLFNNNSTKCKTPIVLMIFPVFRTTELYDYVTLYDGNTSGSTEMGTWSGSALDARPPGFIQSKSANILLHFHTGSVYTDDFNRGFSVNFAFPCAEDLPPPEPDTCPPYFDAMPSPIVFTEPSYTLDFSAKSYQNNLDCGWVFLNNQSQCTGPDNYPVTQIEFLHFETEPDFDFLNVYDGPVYRSKQNSSSLAYDDYFLLGSWSGAYGWEIPTVVRSTLPSIMVTIHTDGTVSDIDDNHKDGVEMRVTNVCSNDPLPVVNNRDCALDSGNVYAQFWTNETVQNPRIKFGHHYLPFNLGYPVIIEQAFNASEDQSLLSSRGLNGVSGEVAIGWQRDASGPLGTNWSCCGTLKEEGDYYKGKILVCQRGDCVFIDKVRMGQNVGAVGVIVVDYAETGVRMGSTMQADGLLIPSVSTISSVGRLLVEATERQAKVYIALKSFQCPYDTSLSPTATGSTYSPTPFAPSSPSAVRAPTAPSPPTSLAPNTTMFFTIPLRASEFTSDVQSRFLDSVNAFFLWVPGTATIARVGPNPENADSTIAEVLVDGNNAGLAYTRWGTASNADKLSISPNVLAISPHQPHQRCVAMDCETTSLRVATWDPERCACSRYMTGSGSFVYIILPILLILLLCLLLCCCCPLCPLFGRWKRQQGHEKVAMDEMHMQDVNMMPRGVKDSEESMRGEGQPFGETEDPPAERRDWDEVDHRRGSALNRPSETDQEPIRLVVPRSDDSDDEREGRRGHVY